MPVDAVNIALGRIRSSAGTVVLGYIAADAHWPGIAPPRSTDADEIDDAEARLFARALRAQGGGLDAHGLGILLANLLGLEVPGSSEAGRGSQVSSHATGAHMSCAQWTVEREEEEWLGDGGTRPRGFTRESSFLLEVFRTSATGLRHHSRALPLRGRTFRLPN